MGRSKISLVGAGNIGGTLALLAGLKELADITLFDISENIAQAKALDISQLSATALFDIKIKGTANYKDLENSDVVIVTAGMPRKPGMSRDDLLTINSKIIQDVGENIKNYCPNAFVIVITNPLDAMVWHMQKVSGLPPEKVVGMAGILDSSRFRFFLAEKLNISIEDISCFVLGGHGDTMVPMLDYTTVAGIPIQKIVEMGWLSAKELEDIVKRTQNGGAEIVQLLKTGSAFYAPASSAIEMAEAYLKNKRKILPCAAYLQGEYNVHDLYIGVPVIIGEKGVEKIIELKLPENDQQKFNYSVQAVQGLIQDLKKLTTE